MPNAVIKNYSYCLAHVPDLVRYGSKPRREIAKDPEFEKRLDRLLRPTYRAIQYAPNQVFIGNMPPDDLARVPRPWFGLDHLIKGAPSEGKFGEIIGQHMFYALLKLADILEPPLFELTPMAADFLPALLRQHALFRDAGTGKFVASCDPVVKATDKEALPIRTGDDLLFGYFNRDNRSEGAEDENLAAHHLLENLCTKASGALALKWLLHRESIGPEKIDFILSCGEEACGDRYQRGGGGMAKAIGEMAGCVNASGFDVKNFCAAPASAMVTAASFVKAGLHKNVVVVGGGSLAKLGMKSQAFLDHKIPVLDDCLASAAFLVSRDDKQSPIIQLRPGTVGKAPIGSSTSDEAVYKKLIVDPLYGMGLKITDVDRFAPELQNPEIMEFAGSGDVANKNYRKIAAMSVLAREIEKAEMNGLIAKIGMPGFAPTQGHIPSAVPYLGHAAEAIKANLMNRVMFVGKASLFLGRCTALYDGVSFMIEKNPKIGRK